MYQIVPIPIMKSDCSSSILINATANAYSHSFCLEYGKNFSLELIATSDGTVNVDVYLELSDSLPATEGSSDSSFVQHEGAAKIMTLSDELYHRVAISPVVAKYGRLLLDGQTGNDATTVVAGVLFKTIPL